MSNDKEGATNSENIIRALGDLPENVETNVVLFSAPTGESFVPLRLNPTAALAGEFRVAATRFAASMARETLVPYSPGRTPSPHEVAYLNVEEIPGLSSLLAQLEGSVNFELFDADDPRAKKLRFYVVSMRRSNPGWAHFIKAVSLKIRLRRSRKIAALLTGAVYDRMEADPLLFDPGFDAVSADGVVLLANQHSFESALGFVAQARAAASQTLTDICSHLRISNWDDFRRTAAGDLNMVSKLRGIAEKMSRDPSYARAMTMESLLAFLAKHPDVEIDVEGPVGSQQLVFHNDPARRWRILKLLDDDYLHSELTNENYEANSKSLRGATTPTSSKGTRKAAASKTRKAAASKKATR
jgi:hypothetical protein